ncbi:hypothetical protein RSOLAG22IIIB_07333 [Rhizoctonia solani]|uniref:Uncharacterized protein n=1 Tax=Rhizoctonia solani TaxID=456999 RepID=A0A0K6FMD1_9AGAM|nr:hypothetical protein RSOLAG22IIIB_07333 [Rhizoctonia solani]
MEEYLDLEEMLKDPEFRKLVSQYKKPPAIKSGPSGSFKASSSKSTTEPRVDHEGEDRGRLRTRDTRAPLYTRNRTHSVSSAKEFEASSRSHQSSARSLPSRRSPSQDSRSRRERSPSPRPKSIQPGRGSKVSEIYNLDQDKNDSRGSQSTSRGQSNNQYRHRHSRSQSPQRYKLDYNHRSYCRSRSRSPRRDKYNSGRYSSHSGHPDSYHAYNNYERGDYPRKRSQSPRHAKTNPPESSETDSSPPDGWDDKGYYHSAKASYETGGKGGDRAGGKRGGPVMVYDRNGRKVKHKTFLEGMSMEDKYFFVKEFNHPFASVAGIPYFNPYGKVPLDDKLIVIIPKASGHLFVSSGQRLDFPEYLEGRAVTRAAVVANIPDNATVEPGKFLTWRHYGSSFRLKVYHYVYKFKPYYYHFRDKTGENNWLIDNEAQEYLKEVGGYLKKIGDRDMDPVEYLRQHASKNLKNKNIQKSYIEVPDTENPYFFARFGADKKYAGSTRAPEGSTNHTTTAASSTKARDARRADRIVAQEEARAKEEARATRPGKLFPANSKGVPKSNGVKVKTETKVNRRVDSDGDSDDKRSKVQKESESKLEFESNEGLEGRKQLLANNPVKKPHKAKYQTELSREDVEELDEGEAPIEELINPDRLEERSESEPTKNVLSVRERARRKMRPRPLSESEPEQGSDNEVGNEELLDPRSELKLPVHSRDAEVFEELEKSSKRTISLNQGRKRRIVDEPEEEIRGSYEDYRANLKQAKRSPIVLSPVFERPPSVDRQLPVDGMRVVKATKMMVNVPTSSPVASRTRKKTT